MEDNSEQYGIAANFTTDVPDYVKCVACLLVLRNPLQFLECGHKICTPCFSHLKKNAADNNTPLCCPVDREEVELQQVVPDNGANRIVGNLRVKCWEMERGCEWSGDLRDLREHYTQCEYVVKAEGACKNDGEDEKAMLKSLLLRVGNCESALQVKNKEIATLNYSLRETKKSLDEKLKRIDLLENENISMKKEIEKMDKMEMKLENLCLKHDVLENKFEAQSKELSAASEKLQVYEKNIADLKAPAIASGEICEVGLDEGDDDDDDDDDDDNDDIDELFERMSKLEEHVTNLENIHFCKYNSAETNKIEFEWVVTDYRRHFERGAQVESPKFFTPLEGYQFKLSIQWGGKKKGLLGIFLKLLRAEGASNENDLGPFTISYTLSLLGKIGTVMSETVNPRNVKEDDKKRYLTIPAGEDSVSGGFGFSEFVKGSEVQKYVINDMLFVRCSLDL